MHEATVIENARALGASNGLANLSLSFVQVQQRHSAGETAAGELSTLPVTVKQTNGKSIF